MDRAKWHLLTLAEQLGNIGSEVSRAIRWKGKDQKLYTGAVYRALELFDLTLADTRWHGARLREIARAREVFCDAFFGGRMYATAMEDMLSYCNQFALAIRR